MGKNIVLDLDSTLIFNTTPRPHIDGFLQFCEVKFNHVSIWTAGNKEWLEYSLTNTIPKLRKLRNFKYEFNSEHCVRSMNGLELKPLEFIWNMDKCHTPENTILLEDRSHHFTANPDNCLNIKPYYGFDHNEFSLPLVSFYMDKVVLPAKDVRDVLPYGPL